MLLGVELPDDIAWPPGETMPTVQDAGNLDTREQRNHVLNQLAQSHPARLLIVCDVRQTPDRGTLALITELAALAGQTRIWLHSPDEASHPAPQSTPRVETWRQQLVRSKLPQDWVLLDTDHPMQWLGQHHE